MCPLAYLLTAKHCRMSLLYHYLFNATLPLLSSSMSTPVNFLLLICQEMCHLYQCCLLQGFMPHLSVLLPSSHPCQLPSLLLPALLLALSMAILPSHRQGKDSLLSSTSRERQKSKKRPKLAILSSDAMQSWITVLPILRESQVFPHSYY